MERIEEELAKLLSAPAPAAYLDEKILGVVLPELSPEALAAAKPVVDACPAGEQALPVRLAALLLSLGEDGTRRTLRRLRCSNALIEEAAVLVREVVSGVPVAFSSEKLPARPPVSLNIYARRLLGKYNLCTVQRLAALGTVLQPEHATDFAALSELAEQLEADGVCCRISQLAVNGCDLMAAGIPAGAGLRKVLEELLEGVIREEYPNEKQTLLAQAKKFSAS